MVDFLVFLNSVFIRQWPTFVGLHWPWLRQCTDKSVTTEMRCHHWHCYKEVEWGKPKLTRSQIAVQMKHCCRHYNITTQSNYNVQRVHLNVLSLKMFLLKGVVVMWKCSETPLLNGPSRSCWCTSKSLTYASETYSTLDVEGVKVSRKN